MELLWLWLLIGDRILAALTPFTSKIGALLNTLAVISEFVFMVLVFFFAPEWWYGLIGVGVFVLTPVIMPKINPDELSDGYVAVTGLLSFLHPVLVTLMYLSLFNVL